MCLYSYAVSSHGGSLRQEVDPSFLAGTREHFRWRKYFIAELNDLQNIHAVI